MKSPMPILMKEEPVFQNVVDGASDIILTLFLELNTLKILIVRIRYNGYVPRNQTIRFIIRTIAPFRITLCILLTIPSAVLVFDMT